MKTKTKLNIKFLILFIGISFFNQGKAFDDIPYSDPHYSLIMHLSDIGVMTGNDGNFNPNNKLTRAEALSVSLKSMNKVIPPELTELPPYKDVNPNTWYAPVVMAGIKEGVITPNDQKYFRPGEAVTKAEFLAMLFRATKADLPDNSDDILPIAQDLSKSDWYYPYFSYAHKQQIADKDLQNKFYPDEKISRRNAAIMTYRQLRSYHGNVENPAFLALQADIKDYIRMVKREELESAQKKLTQINKTTERLIRTKNSADIVSAKQISKAMDHFSEALVAVQYEKDLLAIEQLHLAYKYLRKAQRNSVSIAPFAQELANVIGEILSEI